MFVFSCVFVSHYVFLLVKYLYNAALTGLLTFAVCNISVCLFVCVIQCDVHLPLRYIYVMIFACFKYLNYAVFLTRAADHQMPIIRHFGSRHIPYHTIPYHTLGRFATYRPHWRRWSLNVKSSNQNQFDKIKLKTSHHHRVFSNDQITATKNVHENNGITQ